MKGIFGTLTGNKKSQSYDVQSLVKVSGNFTWNY